MVSARSHRVSRVPWYSGSCQVSFNFGYGALTLSGRLFQSRSPVVTESLLQSEPRDARITVWALPRSLAATYGIDVSFSSSGYLDVSVHRVPFHTLWIGVWMTGVCPAGFPHSDISGSMDICSSPKLFAAYHVFHRLSVPRHPPCALSCLTFLSPALNDDKLVSEMSLLIDGTILGSIARPGCEASPDALIEDPQSGFEISLCCPSCSSGLLFSFIYIALYMKEIL